MRADPIPSSLGARGAGTQRRVAVIGAGIAGLAAARTLQGLTDVTLYEAGDWFGGHAHTVDVTLPGTDGQPSTFGVDTGFLVLNERTYPNLLALFAELDVPLAGSDMSFSAQVPQAGPGGGMLEWSGTSLSTVFSQRRNLARPAFWGMLGDILRFNRLCTRLAERGDDLHPDSPLLQPLDDFLRQHRFGAAFRDWYLLPMLGCIWSCPTDQMLRFPVATLVRFCHNHGLIQVSGRPRWFTVAGGARQYVQKIIDALPDTRLATPVRQIVRDASGVRVVTDSQVERFDAVVLACHTDQALRLLGGEASADERELLGAIRYQANRAVLHTDAAVLPTQERAWAAWNYERGPQPDAGGAQVCLHYLLNKLQPLPTPQPVVVSLNPIRAIDPASVLGEWDYDHPVFDLDAIRAQTRLPAIQGRLNTWYAGAWCGYGFHEDGLKAGLSAARGLLDQWALTDNSGAVHALPGVLA
ncbi:MAG: FAD-dependent oxidoreductase [Hydrogenophaga sp.]|uniref:NAD(P)/FAD-dependent oxidoreductase n=1 Tax=Hydrogenophaga sp. TaxID=1904254 RepID=UPI001DB7985B|nr:FAD-dependent oxidoreductase [Hydrogenophaga sp.]MBX3608425.1 FAD-dependent oxidoreductase [Hydrogenophaga sp.]